MDLRTLAIRGVKWTTVGTILASLFQFLQTLVLARLLRPEDFGLMALIVLVIGIGMRVVDLGLTSAIIQKPEVSQEQFSSVYWLSMAAGTGIFILFAGLTGLIISFFDLEAAYAIYFKVSFLCFLVLPIGATYKAILMKMLRFDLINVIHIGNAVGSFAVGVSLAVKGFGLWALVGAYLFNIGFESILSLFFGWKYAPLKIHFSLKEIKGLLRFGLFEMAAGFVNFFSHNIDKLLIGKFIGPHALGLYTLAWNLVLYPLKQINPILIQVAFPVFTKIQSETKRLARYYYQLVLVLMAINIPLLLGLAVFSKSFILLIFGTQWMEASTTLAMLCLVGIIKCFADPGEKLLLAKGRSDVVFFLNALWSISVFLFVGLILWANPSIEGVAFGQISAGVLVSIIWHNKVSKLGEIEYLKIIKKIAGLLLFALPLLGIYFLFAFFTNEVTLVSFGLQLIVATLVYLLIIAGFFREIMEWARQFVKG